MVAMLVESGILYSMIKVAELSLYIMNSPAFLIVFFSMAQIMCITPTAIFIFVALGIVDNSHAQRTIDRGGRSMGAAITGASFRFARPAFTTTFGRTDTINSGVGAGVSFPVANYAGVGIGINRRASVIEFKSSGDDTVVGTLPEGSRMKDVSERSSYDEMSGALSLRSEDRDCDLEKQEAEKQVREVGEP